MKRERPAPLGVLEFTSALNGEDPVSILKKLRHFVHVVGHQRQIALGYADNDETVENASDSGNDEGSIFSLFNDNDESPAKRQKLSDGKADKTPLWQMDKNNYQVPFVGTSVAKGEVGSLVLGTWPTGFLEAFRTHSPLGVELVRNDYISALPPNGIHHSLCKSSSAIGDDSGRKRKKYSTLNNANQRELTHDQIVSHSLQYYYWTALSEWVMGFVPIDMLKREMFWENTECDSSALTDLSLPERNTETEKCAIPPEIMTILMKQRLSEWVDTVNNYAYQQYQHNQQLLKTKQQQKQQRKKPGNSKEEQQMQQKIQPQHQIQWRKRQCRDGILLASAIRNFRALCYISIGTAREVLRRLTAASSTVTKTASGAGSTKAGDNTSSNSKGKPGDGKSWMVELLQQKSLPLSTASLSSSRNNPQVECLNLVCTLLETKDYAILTRICQVPAWPLKHSNRAGKSDGNGMAGFASGGNFGLLYIALRCGMQHLIDATSREDGGADALIQYQSELFARGLTRLLKDVRQILLPNDKRESSKDEKANRQFEGFVLGAGATADLLSGEVLVNLTKLTMLAPSIGSSLDYIHGILSGEDRYNSISSVESAAVEARRLLFILLSGAQSSPFLNVIRRERVNQPKNDEKSAAHLSQLSKALHTLLLDRGINPSIRVLLRTCLDCTPQLVPYIFRGLHLSDPKPNYRTLSSLTLVDCVVRDAPSAQNVVSSHHDGQITSGTISREHFSLGKVIPAIIPNCVSKVTLGKIVQSSSTLLVSCGLKLIVTLLLRANEFVSALVKETKEGECHELKESICQAILNHLPQMSLLLSIPTRFDPFVKESCRANAIVVMELFKSLELYGQLDASFFALVQFDWVKVLPIGTQVDSDDFLSRHFFNAEPLLQSEILRALATVSRLDNLPSSKLLSHVLSILTATNVPEVYAGARDLALALVEKVLFSQADSNLVKDDEETESCNKFESSLWVDGICTDTIQDLILWIGELQHHRVQHKIFVSQAWSNSDITGDMPPLRVSLLLSFLISQLLQNEMEMSAEFSMLLVRISTKLLIFQSDAKPTLASVIAFASAKKSHSSAHIARLSRFAMAILEKDTTTMSYLKSLESVVFDSDTACISAKTASTLLHSRRLSSSNVLRECLSLIKYQGSKSHDLRLLLHQILAYSFEMQKNIPDAISVLDSAFTNKILDPTDMECIATFLLSFSKPSSGNTLHLPASMRHNTVSVEMELTCAVLQLSLRPTNSLPGIIDDVLKCTLWAVRFDSSHQLRDFLLIILLQTVPTEGTSHFPPEAVFDLWASLSKHLSSELSVKLCIRLENYLAHLFESPDAEQDKWTIYQRIIDMSPELFTGACLTTIGRRAAIHETYASCLLSTVLGYDCSRFHCIAHTISGVESDIKLVKLWNDGFLDHIVSTFVLQMKVGTLDPVYGRALAVIGERLICLIGREDTGGCDIPTKTVLRVLQVLCDTGSLPSGLPDKLVYCIRALEHGSRSPARIEDEISLIELASSAYSVGENTPLLLTHAFVRCCKLLPKWLKSFARNNQSSAASLATLVNVVLRILDRSSSFDHEMVSFYSNAIDKFIVSCLKYGIMEVEDQTACLIYGKCLKIVGLILNACSTSQPLTRFSPGQIHSMVTSHSSFQKAVSKKIYKYEEASSETQQLELIRLLIQCVSVDAEHVKVDAGTWVLILSAYNASMSDADGMLRRLMLLYEVNQCSEEKTMMINFRWGTMASQQDKIDQGWEWFLDSLDGNRIRLTLTQFPVSDMLECPQENFIKKAIASADSHENEDDGALSEDAEKEQDYSDNKRPSVVSGPDKTMDATCIIRKSSLDQWRGNGEDCRFSPGFILPLVLGALEEYMPLELDADSLSPKSVNEKSDEDDKNEEPGPNREQHQTFCHFSKRLCDKGAISLALASLSSRCPTLRKVAVAICGLFLKALQMPESHAIKSWRDRPQIEMLMSSVQRGLAVRRAIQIQRAKEAQGVYVVNVPMLPAVSAVFLAKSLLILSRPGDDMYGSINRYFLRLNDYHGAFQDCFTLPAFLSLYCNSSDDESRCRIERNWALFALKDGAVDEFCYQIIAKHHIPELIMSSIDMLMDSPESSGEVSLTIDVLCSLIEAGGSRAVMHLINRLGLLSWVHGIIGWRQISLVLPYTAVKCKFLKLLTVAVRAYITSSAPEASPFYEKVPLSDTVIRICLEGHSRELMEQTFHDPSSALLLLSTCDALWEIHLADQQSCQDVITVDHVCGKTSIDDMAALLAKFVSQNQMFEKVLTAMCTLPFVMTQDSPAAAILFCKLALGYVAYCGSANDRSKVILLSLQRVHELTKHYQLGKEDSMVQSLVLKCRRLAIRVDGGIQVWEHIMTLLQDAKCCSK